ncbi:MAG: hypothetical protein Q7J13_16375, partial [Brevundimonas sp.]|nr:hypothetical protein [Brevundimonas sp.]
DPICDLHTGQRRVKGRINRPDTRKHLIRPRQNLEKTSCIERGVHTRIFVYPGDEAHLAETDMEQVVSRQTTEELPYVRAFEADAQVMDVEPGQALTWPFYAPHRVENLDRYCVSLSIEFQTWPTRFRNGALFTNAVLRSRGARPRMTDRMTTPELAARWAASLALKRAGALKSRIATFERDFQPELGVEDGAGALRA